MWTQLKAKHGYYKMELKQIEVYDFEELSDEVREKVLNKFRENNEYDFLDENLNEELNILLKEAEIKPTGEISLRYSLSCCQGDGLSFIGDFKFKDIDFEISLGHLSNHYAHSNTTDINTADEYDDSDDITEEIREIREKEFREIYFKICDELEKSGYNYIEAEDSDENLKENIKVNEYKFLVNGEIF